MTLIYITMAGSARIKHGGQMPFPFAEAFCVNAHLFSAQMLMGLCCAAPAAPTHQPSKKKKNTGGLFVLTLSCKKKKKKESDSPSSMEKK